MSNTISHTIYDVITKETIFFYKNTFIKQCQERNFDNTAISHLCGNSKKKQLSYKERFISLKNKDKIFTLVDYETKKEYDCISNYTLFIHLGKDYNENEGKYVYELKAKRQSRASICGKIFYLKGNEEKVNFKNTSKVENESILNYRRKTKLKQKIKRSLLNNINKSLEKNFLKKESKTKDLIGADMESFKSYFESLFEPWMNWENHGLWHIDHIVPSSAFDLLEKESLLKCFNYKNLRPCEARENILKKDKLTEKGKEFLLKNPDYLKYIVPEFKNKNKEFFEEIIKLTFSI